METRKFENGFPISGDMTGDDIKQQCRERLKTLRTIAGNWIVRELIEKRGGVNCWLEQTVTENGGCVQLTVEVHYIDPYRRVPDPYQPSQFFMLPKGKVDFTFQAKDDPAVRERLEKLKSLFSPVDTRTMETTDDEPCDDWGAPMGDDTQKIQERYGEPPESEGSWRDRPPLL